MGSFVHSSYNIESPSQSRSASTNLTAVAAAIVHFLLLTDKAQTDSSKPRAAKRTKSCRPLLQLHAFSRCPDEQHKSPTVVPGPAFPGNGSFMHSFIQAFVTCPMTTHSLTHSLTIAAVKSTLPCFWECVTTYHRRGLELSVRPRL